MTAWIFYGFSVIAVVASLAVILLRNPVRSALSLVVSFFSVSAIYVLLHAPFLGVIQILVYTGAIMVLFLYIMMLLNMTEEGEQKSDRRISNLAALALLPILLFLVFGTVSMTDFGSVAVSEDFGSLFSVGEKLLSEFVLLYELISILLLAAIVGAVAFALKNRKEHS